MGGNNPGSMWWQIQIIDWKNFFFVIDGPDFIKGRFSNKDRRIASVTAINAPQKLFLRHVVYSFSPKAIIYNCPVLCRFALFFEEKESYPADRSAGFTTNDFPGNGILHYLQWK